MPNRENLWKIFIFFVSLGTFTFLAAGLSNLALNPGTPFHLDMGLWRTSALGNLRLRLPGLGFLLALMTILYWPLLIVGIFFFITSPDARRRVLRNVIILTAMYFSFYLLFRNWQGINLPDLQRPSGSPGGESLFGELVVYAGSPPNWLVYLVSFVLFGILMGFVWRIARRFRRPETALDLLVDGAKNALEELSSGADLKDTVIRCYYQMSQIMSARRGLKRQTAMTPREFERSLREAGFRIGHVHRLTRLFEQVRYGGRVPSAQDEREAVECLAAIVETYGRGP
jgi:hypothetical protein